VKYSESNYDTDINESNFSEHMGAVHKRPRQQLLEVKQLLVDEQFTK